MLTERGQLLGAGHSLRVRGDHQRGVSGASQVKAELGRGCRLAGALEADEHDDRGRRFGFLEGRVPPAEHFDHLQVDDVDDLLHGAEALGDVCAERPLADAGDEVLDDFVVDVGLEQGEADLAQSLVEVFLGDGAAPAQAPEYALQLIGKGVKHIYKMRF